MGKMKSLKIGCILQLLHDFEDDKRNIEYRFHNQMY